MLRAIYEVTGEAMIMWGKKIARRKGIKKREDTKGEIN